MEMDSALKINEGKWDKLYEAGSNDLRYPNDVFVRFCSRYLNVDTDRKILDYGCGTGANLVHLAQAGFDVSGVEISDHALQKAASRIAEKGLAADLRCIRAGDVLPFPPARFDAVIAWQVLCYNDWNSLKSAVQELERVLRPGGIMVCATTQPGDISQTMSDSLGDGLYRSRVPGQDGCILVIPDRAMLQRVFPERQLEVGEFGYRIGSIVARHWLISYRKT
jgi:SAM-dependent methyltransferase